MPEVADAWVSIYPKFSNGFASSIQNEVKKSYSKGATSGGDAFVKEGKAQGRKFGDGFKSAIGPAMAAVSIAGLASFVKGATDAFSELEDATAAAGVVFGDNMDSIISQSEDAARSMGMSKKQVIDAANTFGTYGKGAGLAGDALADFSEQMTQTAGDMASFKGGTPEEAIQAVGAALRGEAEPIRRYGVLLDDATLRAQALKMGLISSTKEALTPQNKVLAAQAEILRQTTDAQGDFARTSDSTANVAKTLAAESANLSAELGAKLAPAVTAAKKAGIELLTWVSDNQAALVPLVATFGTLTLAIGGFVGAAKGIEALKSAKATIDGLKTSFDGMSRASKVATISLGAVGIAATVAAVAYGAIAQKSADAQAAIEDYTAAIEADSGALGENTRRSVANRLEREGMLAQALKMGISTDTLTDAILGNSDAYNEAKQKADEYARANMGQSSLLYGATGAALGFNKKLEEQAGYLQQGTEAQKRTASAIGGTDAAAKNAAGSVGNLSGSVDDSATSAKTAATAFETYAEKMNKAYDASLQLRSDRRGLKAAFDDATESVKKNGKTLNENTDEGRANQEALDGIVQKGRDWAQSLKDQKKPQSEINAAMKESRDDFIKAATAMGMSGSAAAQMATDLGLVKDPATEAADRLKELKKKAKELNGQRVRISVAASMSRSADEIVYKTTGAGTMKFTARADGGDALAGRLHKVGERGWEWFVPKKDGYVVNQQQAAAAAAKQGSGAQGAGVLVNIVNHYPQAEPTSRTLNRGLEQIAFLGVSG